MPLTCALPVPFPGRTPSLAPHWRLLNRQDPVDKPAFPGHLIGFSFLTPPPLILTCTHTHTHAHTHSHAHTCITLSRPGFHCLRNPTVPSDLVRVLTDSALALPTGHQLWVSRDAASCSPRPPAPRAALLLGPQSGFVQRKATRERGPPSAPKGWEGSIPGELRGRPWLMGTSPSWVPGPAGRAQRGPSEGRWAARAHP